MDEQGGYAFEDDEAVQKRTAGDSPARDSFGQGPDNNRGDESNLAPGLGTDADLYQDETRADPSGLGNLDPLGQDHAQDHTQTALDLSQSEMQEALSKAFEDGFHKGATEAKEKALVQESLKAEMALKELENKEAEYAEKEKAALQEREQLRKEYEQEILLLKEKIQSFDDSLLGELEKKKEQLDLEMQPRIKVLTDLCDQLKSLTQDSQTFFEPLKRLSVHIAEQLVLGELSISTNTIQRLIHRCVDELNMRDNPVVRVELNALDKLTLESVLNLPTNQGLNALVLNSSQTMQVGSVRVLVNDTQIEDLIQNRLETIAARLLGQPQKWRDESKLLKTLVQGSYITPAEKEEPISEEQATLQASSVQASELVKSQAHSLEAATQDEGISANLTEDPNPDSDSDLNLQTNGDEQQPLPKMTTKILEPNAQSLSSSSLSTDFEGISDGLDGEASAAPPTPGSISGEESNDA